MKNVDGRLWSLAALGWGLLLLLCGPANAAPSAAAAAESHYVSMRDGVRLAVDVWLAPGSATVRRPAIVQFTRYWRAFKATGGPLDPEGRATLQALTAAGYAVVVVDVRGTGASFGARETEFSDVEVRDYGEVFDWIEKQAWSNGRVATFGASYLGNTAELAASLDHRALRAVVPRFSDFSEYRHAVRPGGVRNAVIADAWVRMITALDRNDACAAFDMPVAVCSRTPLAQGVKPVDGDGDGRLLAEAIREHGKNADLATLVGRLEYSDDPFGDGSTPATLESVSPSRRWRAIDRSRTPAYHWASWFDGGTAEGVLTRFLNYRSPLRVVIGAWTHGGGRSADPYRRDGVSVAEPPPDAQLADILAFLDPLMKGGRAASPPGRRIDYFTLGVGQWRSTTQWPPDGITPVRYYFQAAGGLGTATPSRNADFDAYRVDREATTGSKNRWHTQLGAPVDYGDRADQARRLLTYTSGPLSEALEITGSPVIRVTMTSTSSDGALFAYLEDVAPDGRATYLSEGQLRLAFNGPAMTTALGPTHAFTTDEARPRPPGEQLDLDFTMAPISVVLPPGHCIRISLAGADAGTFAPHPSESVAAIYRIARGGAQPSHVDLPIRVRAERAK